MSDDKKRPSHRLVLVSERSFFRNNKPETKTTYSEICALWPTEKGNLSGEIPAGMALTGRIIIAAADTKPAAGDDAGAAGTDNSYFADQE